MKEAALDDNSHQQSEPLLNMMSLIISHRCPLCLAKAEIDIKTSLPLS